MTEASGPKADELSHPACRALERLADKRYGREAPALSWSITQELVDAGLVMVQGQGRNGVSITRSGHDFLRRRAAR
jgi:hypothetical protein